MHKIRLVTCLFAVLFVVSCGLKGPLYQTPEQVPEPKSKKIDLAEKSSEQLKKEQTNTTSF
jgi:predicted small lipoprotein YifL